MALRCGSHCALFLCCVPVDVPHFPPSPQLYLSGQYFGTTTVSSGVTCMSTGVTDNSTFPLRVLYGHAHPTIATAYLTFEALQCSVTAPDIRVGCLMGPGTGMNHSWQVLVDGQPSGSLPVGSFYAPPFVTQFSGPASPAARTEGGQVCVRVCVRACAFVCLDRCGCPSPAWICTSRFALASPPVRSG